MSNTHTLTNPRDIQKWVIARQGMPAISRVRDRMGGMRSRLALSFDRARMSPAGQFSVDDGMSPCSWTAWLAELDRQRLALRVSTTRPTDYELVERKDLN